MKKGAPETKRAPHSPDQGAQVNSTWSRTLLSERSGQALLHLFKSLAAQVGRFAGKQNLTLTRRSIVSSRRILLGRRVFVAPGFQHRHPTDAYTRQYSRGTQSITAPGPPVALLRPPVAPYGPALAPRWASRPGGRESYQGRPASPTVANRRPTGRREGNPLAMPPP